MLKKLPYLLAFAVCASLLLVACGGATDNANSAANTSNTKGGANTAASPAATTTTTASTGDKIGVAECDDFIAKYESCVNSKVPDAARATVKSSLETWRNSWRELAKTPQGKAGLAQACKAAHDQARTSMGTYGCTW
jgi:pectate lyase